MKICKNCNKKNCDRLRKELCNMCYTKQRKFGDANYKSIKSSDVPTILSEQQKELITGHLLGDGHIRRRVVNRKGIEYTCNAAFSLMRQAMDIKYAEYTVNNLSNLFVSNPLPLKIKDKFDKRTNKIYKYVNFDTKNLTVLNGFRSKWYDKNGIKIIPKDLKLSPLICAIWFADDGCITKIKNNSYTIQFATDGFKRNDVIFLAKNLKNIFDCKVHIYKRKNGAHIIRGSNDFVFKFLKYINSVFNFGMERKFGIGDEQ